MTVWQIILVACCLALAIKLLGYLVPPSALERPTPARIAALVTVSLLAALVVVQTFERDRAFVLDARLLAVVVAGVLFALRVPFIVVIAVAALVAALLRLLLPLA